MSETTNNTVQVASEEMSNKEKGYHIYPQLIAGFTATITVLCAGLAFAWPSLAIPKLLDKNSEFHITSDQAAWIISALQMGACIGPILSALIVDRIGRKWFLYACGVPYLICWVLIYSAESFGVLFLARIVCGIGIGGVFAAIPMYLGEIAEVRVRGALGSMMSLMMSFGSLTSYLFGYLAQGKTLSVINMIPITIFLLAFFWMPETPYYYLKKNKVEDAKKSLKRLRKSEFVDSELTEMTDLLKKESEHRGRIIELVTVQTNRRATFIMWLLLSAQQCSGIVVMLSYSLTIFENTASEIAPDVEVILSGAVSFMSGIVATCIVDKLGKKPLFIVSSSGVSLSLCALAACMLYSEQLKTAEHLHWVPLASVLLYHIFFSFGLGPVPYATLAEIYPTSVKAAATMVSSIYGSLLGVVVSKMFQVIADEWGYHTIIFCFCVIELFFMCVALFVMPETKGKTFKEIQEVLDTKMPESGESRF